MTLPTDPKARKAVPLCTGVLDYFPDALAAVAAVSKAGNDQHNPGQELHWARGKSTDQADCLLRHLAERGTVDTDGHRHSAKVAWRALALLQEELEREEKRPLSRGSRLDAPIEYCKHCTKNGRPMPRNECLFHAGGQHHEQSLSQRDFMFPEPDGDTHMLPMYDETGVPWGAASPKVDGEPTESWRRALNLCTDCGVDLEEQAHSPGCLRLNQPMR